MNTFLPNKDFIESAKTLDGKRLWKQVLEANQMLEAIVNKTDFYKNHPARKMWENHPEWLRYYRDCVMSVWLNRRIQCQAPILEFKCPNTPPPDWLGDEEFHRSHRSNLTRKLKSHYSKYWTEDSNIPYVWPTKRNQQ